MSENADDIRQAAARGITRAAMCRMMGVTLDEIEAVLGPDDGAVARRAMTGKDVKALALEFTAEAVMTLAEIAGDRDAAPSARIAAATALLDRGHGKPGQVIESSLSVTVTRGDLLAMAPADAYRAMIEGVVVDIDEVGH